MLAICLDALVHSHTPPGEIIVVDDGTPEPAASALATLVAQKGARLIRQTRSGPAVARNAGAAAAAGSLLAFVDADVRVHPDTLGQLTQALERDPGLAAVFGSYDDAPAAATLVSDYRNLLHHHVHQNSSRRAVTFWSGLGAIRRADLLAADGFASSYGRPSIEDVELGLRLHAAGKRVELHREIQAQHLKRWTLWGMFRTDLFDRAIPWTELLAERSGALPQDLNFRWTQRLSVQLALLFLFSLLAATRLPWAAGSAALLCLALLAVLNAPFLGFLARRRGLAFACAALPAHLVHLWASGAGLVGGLLRIWRRRDPWAGTAAATLAVAVLASQIASGTYQADFGLHPDEPGHYVTGVMVAEYLRQLPADPMRFAESYYLHYPKVTLGHWPPVYYLAEGLWIALLGSSRGAVIALQAALGFLLLLGVYVLARRWVSFALALAAAFLLFVAGAMQWSLQLVMTDTATSLLVLAATVAFARYLDEPGWTWSLLFGLLSALALLTKGSAITLAAVPLLSAALTRRWTVLRRPDFWGSALPVVMLAFPWYTFAKRFSSPNKAAFRGTGDWDLVWVWAVPLALAFVAAFVLPLRRDAVGAALVALVAAFAAAPAFISAFQEDRHWLPGMAAAAVLATAAWAAIPRAALPMALLSVLLAAQNRPRLPVAMFRPWAAMPLPPGAVLVSGSASEEGALVAALAEQHPAPERYVFRASRVLASSSWNGGNYRLTAPDTGAAASLLRALGVRVVIQTPGANFPHDALINEATRTWPRHTAGSLRLRVNPDWAPGSAVGILQERLGHRITAP